MQGFAEEEVCAVKAAVVLVVEVFEEVGVLSSCAAFNQGGCEGAVGENAEEGGEREFLFEVQEDEEDEVGVEGLDGFVESQLVFFHREEEGHLFAGAGFVVEELSGEVGATFVVGGAGDDLKGETGFVGEFGDDGRADCVFVGWGVTDFLGSPVDVDFVSWEMEVVRDSDC